MQDASWRRPDAAGGPDDGVPLIEQDAVAAAQGTRDDRVCDREGHQERKGGREDRDGRGARIVGVFRHRSHQGPHDAQAAPCRTTDRRGNENDWQVAACINWRHDPVRRPGHAWEARRQTVDLPLEPRLARPERRKAVQPGRSIISISMTALIPGT